MAKKPVTVVNHPWDRAKTTVLTRVGSFGQQQPLDPGVNFFVLALEALGARPRFSCEGHPLGFYVAFEAPYELALQIHGAGFFSVEILGPDYWAIRKTNTEHMAEGHSEVEKARTLRWAADAWARVFGDRLASLECISMQTDAADGTHPLTSLSRNLDAASQLPEQCWSCLQPVTETERRDNDGLCPHCNAELSDE